MFSTASSFVYACLLIALLYGGGSATAIRIRKLDVLLGLHVVDGVARELIVEVGFMRARRPSRLVLHPLRACRVDGERLRFLHRNEISWTDCRPRATDEL